MIIKKIADNGNVTVTIDATEAVVLMGVIEAFVQDEENVPDLTQFLNAAGVTSDFQNVDGYLAGIHSLLSDNIREIYPEFISAQEQELFDLEDSDDNSDDNSDEDDEEDEDDSEEDDDSDEDDEDVFYDDDEDSDEDEDYDPNDNSLDDFDLGHDAGFEDGFSEGFDEGYEDAIAAIRSGELAL